MPTDRIVARDLMHTSFRTVSADRPLREAIRSLLSGSADAARLDPMVVVDADGGYAGVLTAREVLAGLIAPWSPPEELRAQSARLESALFERVVERADGTVGEALGKPAPCVPPDAGILAMIEAVCPDELEVLPVVEGGRAIGLVPINELYYAVTRLSITPDDEGIRL